MNSLKRFRSQCKGNVATFFAIAALPILVGSGLAVDYARAVSRRSVLQNGLDAAVISILHSSTPPTVANIKSRITAYINTLDDHGQDLGIKTLYTPDVTYVAPLITAKIRAEVETTLMKLVGINHVNVEVKTQAGWDTADIVIVLDNSTDLGSTRLNALKTAIDGFITTVGGTDGTVAIGLVPYTSVVRVPVTTTYTQAQWIRFPTPPEGEDGEDGEDGTTAPSTWKGCMMDRDSNLSTINYDTDDTKYNEFMALGDPAKKYPALDPCPSTAENTMQAIMPVGGVSTFGALKTEVSNMTTAGKTNMTIGVAWGHAMLSEAITPFTTAKPKDTAHHRRIIILIAGSANTLSRHYTGTSSTDTTKRDGRTTMACTSAKLDKIEIYTVNVSFNGTMNDALLSDCSTTPGHFFDTAATADIPGVFNQLAIIRQPRLTH